MELQHQCHALEKEMATHSSVLAWRIPGTEEPGGLPSMGLHTIQFMTSFLVVGHQKINGGLNLASWLPCWEMPESFRVYPFGMNGSEVEAGLSS